MQLLSSKMSRQSVMYKIVICLSASVSIFVCFYILYGINPNNDPFKVLNFVDGYSLLLHRSATSSTLSTSSPNDLTTEGATCGFIAFSYLSPGIGNILFQYASLYGISRKTGHRLIMPRPYGHNVNDYFDLNTKLNHSNINTSGLVWHGLVESQASAYKGALTNLDCEKNYNIFGYLTSWWYFNTSLEDIRHQFRFKPHILAPVDEFLRKALNETGSTSNVTFIGVHVRRGDFLSERSVKFGYSVASAEYLARASAYFEERFHNILYIVCSNGMKWVKEKFKPKHGKVVFSEDKTAIHDLALLSRCNHTIMTVGSYGWWGAWLAGGQVVYSKDVHKSGSPLERVFSKHKKDYFMPQWVGF